MAEVAFPCRISVKIQARHPFLSAQVVMASSAHTLFSLRTATSCVCTQRHGKRTEREPSRVADAILAYSLREPHLKTPFTFIGRDRRSRARAKGGKISTSSFREKFVTAARRPPDVSDDGIYCHGKTRGPHHLLSYLLHHPSCPVHQLSSFLHLNPYHHRVAVAVAATTATSVTGDLKRR